MLFDFVPQFTQAQDELGETVTFSSVSSVTPTTANTFTAYSQVFSSTPFDSYGFLVEMTSHNLAARQTIYSSLEIATGASGSEVLLIENMNPGNVRQGIRAEAAFSNYFPVFIPAGTRIAARGAMSLINSSQITYRITLYRATNYPFNEWVGNTITPYGSDRTNLNSSVTLTPGGTPDVWGSWTQITSSTTRRHKAFIVQLYPPALSNPAEYLGTNIQLAIGASGSEHIISHVQRHTQNPETGWNHFLRPIKQTVIYRDVPAGTRLSARSLYGSYSTPVNTKVSVYGIS
jgi:hypothetical protein